LANSSVTTTSFPWSQPWVGRPDFDLDAAVAGAARVRTVARDGLGVAVTFEWRWLRRQACQCRCSSSADFAPRSAQALVVALCFGQFGGQALCRVAGQVEAHV
jgi:hypothetical protein